VGRIGSWRRLDSSSQDCSHPGRDFIKKTLRVRLGAGAVCSLLGSSQTRNQPRTAGDGRASLPWQSHCTPVAQPSQHARSVSLGLRPLRPAGQSGAVHQIHNGVHALFRFRRTVRRSRTTRHAFRPSTLDLLAPSPRHASIRAMPPPSQEYKSVEFETPHAQP